MILFLFFAHLGLGIIITLVWVSREAGVKFFRFNAGLAAILIAFAFAFRSGDSDLSGANLVALAALAMPPVTTLCCKWISGIRSNRW